MTEAFLPLIFCFVVPVPTVLPVSIGRAPPPVRARAATDDISRRSAASFSAPPPGSTSELGSPYIQRKSGDRGLMRRLESSVQCSVQARRARERCMHRGQLVRVVASRVTPGTEQWSHRCG
jgi:hypothetical protein